MTIPVNSVEEEDKMKIRKARKEDIKKIAEIFKEEYSKPPYNGKWDKKNSIKAINEHFKKYEIYIGESNKQIVGFIVIEKFTSFGEEVCFIDEIVISSGFQRKGFGKTLMKFIEKYCKKNKIKKVKLSTNKKAHAFRFYKKIGFKEIESISMEKKIR